MIFLEEKKQYQVLLIEPGESFAENGCFVLAKQTPSSGLGFISSYLKKCFPEISIKIFDQQNQRGTPGSVDDYFLSFLSKENPEIVGIQAYSYNFLDACIIAKKVREVFPGTFILMGGPYPTVCPEEVLVKCGYVDGIVVGEGEEVLHDLVRSGLLNISLKDICNLPGLYNRNSSFISRPPISNLDSLPFPDWSMFSYKYRYSRAYSYKFRSMEFLFPISSSRGCPFSCSICAGQYLSKTVRSRSPESVIEELIYNWETQYARFFYFVDPNFLFDVVRAGKICDLIREEINYKRRGRISFKIQTRVNFGNEEIFYKLRMAGCELIFLGIESGDDEVLRENKPDQTREMVKKTVSMIRKVGIRVRASFVLGLPFETEETIKRTASFISELDLDGVAFHTLDVYPGTTLHKKIKDGWGGLYFDQKEEKELQYSRGRPSYGVNDLSPEVLGEIKNQFSETFPSLKRSRVRDDIIRKNLSELRYFFDWDRNIFDQIVESKLSEIKKVSCWTQ